MKTRIGVVGCGQRGHSLVKDLFCDMPNVQIVAVCDDYPGRAETTARLVKSMSGKACKAYLDYGEMLGDSNIEAVLVVSPWETHIPFAIRAMEAGIPVGIEVAGASNLQECWDLVRTFERTRVPFMFLENCCFGHVEMAVMNMVRKGLFGEIVHCAGAYAHDLRNEIAYGDINHHYRLRHYHNRNGENYPTHELGPIAKLLNINTGNKMLTLTSAASKARGMNAYGAEGVFNQGDIVNTVIKCAGGETILLTLDTTLPRYYCRDFTVRGVNGMYEERTNSIFIDGVHEDHFNWKPNWNNAEEYLKEYDHPLWQAYRKSGLFGGHDGMDALVYGAFVECLQNGWDMPIDVYDAAAWMAITPLSEISIASGSLPVEIPDFTSGRWMNSSDPMNIYANKRLFNT